MKPGKVALLGALVGAILFAVSVYAQQVPDNARLNAPFVRMAPASSTITVNSEGASGAPVSVSSATAATTIFPSLSTRSGVSIRVATASGKVNCAPLGTTPSSTVGISFADTDGWISEPFKLAPQVGWSCVFTSGSAVSIDTVEDR